MPAPPSPPILVWVPGGGISGGGPVSQPPVYSQAGITPLIVGQAYVDVVFGSVQIDNSWVLVECDVVNTADVSPLNIWQGLITNRTTAGFRVWLNGLPDTANYYLHWAVSGINITPVPATTYLLSVSPADTSIFTVRLPSSTTVPAPITITPHDGGAGGSFSPPSVTIATTSASATFVYTPATYGTKTISTTNSSTLIDPAGIVVSFVAPTYSLSGPSTGVTGVASTNFTVALSGAVLGTLTVTPHATGGGTFTPTTVNLTTGAPSATFTYTPASVGAKTISVTNSGGLTNPANLTYTATAPALADGDPVSSWTDSSTGGHTATQTGSARPTFKIVSGMRVVRFTSAAFSSMTLASPVSSVSPWTIFAVFKPSAPTGVRMLSIAASSNFVPVGPFGSNDGAGSVFVGNRNGYANNDVAHMGDWRTAFHVYAAIGALVDSGSGLVYDGNAVGATFGALAATGNFDTIGANPFSPGYYSDGDLAEIIVYSTTVTGTDHNNVTKYLGTKYAITVAGGGTAVSPDTVTGLVAWWKADSLG